jgi:type II secretory pathway predicted ATPase ExeA
MTGEERLSVALRLHELACAMAREGIRQQHPGASADEVERLLRLRLEFARGETLQDILAGRIRPKAT